MQKVHVKSPVIGKITDVANSFFFLSYEEHSRLPFSPLENIDRF